MMNDHSYFWSMGGNSWIIPLVVILAVVFLAVYLLKDKRKN